MRRVKYGRGNETPRVRRGLIEVEIIIVGEAREDERECTRDGEVEEGGEDSSSIRSACGDGGLCSQALSETNTCVFVCALPRPASSSTACLCVCGGLWLWRVYISCPLSFKFTIFKRRPAVPSFLPPHLPLQLSVFHPSILFFSVSVARSLSLWLASRSIRQCSSSQ